MDWPEGQDGPSQARVQGRWCACAWATPGSASSKTRARVWALTRRESRRKNRGGSGGGYFVPVRRAPRRTGVRLRSSDEQTNTLPVPRTRPAARGPQAPTGRRAAQRPRTDRARHAPSASMCGRGSQEDIVDMKCC